MKISFDRSRNDGNFKILNATNGGPWGNKVVTDQFRSNFADYKAARFTYTRNHDSGVNGVYGGPFSHDITKIFRNFDADVNDPASYDFICTDAAIFNALAADTQTFFRLGETIEHHVKKHSTLPPKDFQKWAEICEHIILHYNYGWADGFELDMKYWEIWNEPDLDPDDSKNKRTWGGTKAQFFDMYEIAAKHLKSRFPELNIGGPAVSGNLAWSEDFLCEMQKRGVPIDFFSWHSYASEPQKVVSRAEKMRELLDKYGYGDAESILNEWNYVKGWKEEFKYSMLTIHSMKGAAYTMATICASASAPVDMLMYYDTRPTAFCGAFDFYSFEKLKGYYPFYWYGKFYEEGMRRVIAEQEFPQIYTLCGVDGDGRALAIVAHYSDDDSVEPKDVEIDLGGGSYEVYYLDEEHDADSPVTTDSLSFRMKVNTCILIKEIF